MKVIVHGGANQIGGSCIEIASAKTRIILDCGWPLENALDLPPGIAAPKALVASCLEGTFQLSPPPVPGLFAPGKPPNAVLLSHAHPDHTGFIDVMDARVLVYATIETSKIMKV